MAIGWLTYCVAIAALLHSGPAWGESVKEVVAEASYVMGDADTLASAEHHALLRAKRKAVEAAGVYVEASSQNIETYSGGKTRHLTTLSVRTLAAVVTQTDILRPATDIGRRPPDLLREDQGDGQPGSPCGGRSQTESLRTARNSLPIAPNRAQPAQDPIGATQPPA